jgi:LacI family transcriptional regulator
MTRSKPSSVTIRDVARQAQVSVATVSRYINQTAPVSDDVAARVQAAMSALSFVPQASARRLATHKTHTVGMLVSEMHGDFFGPMFAGIESVTSAAGYDLLISSRTGNGPRKEFPWGLGPHNTDGLLVFWDSLSEAGLTRACELAFPVVLIHQSPPEGLSIPCVTVENKAASKRIVEHLIEVHGRRRIVFLRGPQNNEDSYWREIGYRQALEGCGLPYDERLVGSGNFEREAAMATVAGLLRDGLDFDAVFAADDESAVGVLTALRAARRRVPEDVAVVGFDDQRLSAHLTPPLTTVRAPTEEVGRRAAHQLLNLLQKKAAEPLTLLPSELVIRRSCGCAAEA